MTAYAVAPENYGTYIQAGERFKMLEVCLEPEASHKGSFYIKTNHGTRAYCLFEGCAHISGKNWIIEGEYGKDQLEETDGDSTQS